MLITVIYYTPTLGPPNASISFSIYKSNTNLWGTSQQSGVKPLATYDRPIHPGANSFVIRIPEKDLSNLYISAHGSIRNDVPPVSIFIAEPPSGNVSDGAAFGVWGPPWISLAELSVGMGLSADLHIVSGQDNQEGSSHPWVVGAWAINFRKNQEVGAFINNLSAASGRAYEIVENGLADGAVIFIDRDYTYAGVPAGFEGASYIKTANDDKSLAGSNILSFDINQNAEIYVAHDDRIETKPTWLSAFIDTEEDVIIAGNPHSLWHKTFSPGTVTLGENLGAGNSMYTVIVQP